MFVIRPESIKTFVNDKTVRLPRFQRKQTWGYLKNFNLCVSLFKNYPVGVIVVKIEATGQESPDPKRRTDATKVKWLLDGRQRHSAMMRMRNPEDIYRWAKATLGLTNGMDSAEVADAFWRYITDYLQPEEEQEDESFNDTAVSTHVAEGSNDVDIETIEEDLEESIEEKTEIPTTMELPSVVMEPVEIVGNVGGLEELLRIILLVHPLKKHSSGFTTPFDFIKLIPNLEYVKTESSGKKVVNAETLIAWVESRKKYAEINDKPALPSQEDFYEWLSLGKTGLKDAKIKAELSKKWDRIEYILRTLTSLDERFQDTQIGYLEIKDCTDNDAKKIFEIINSAGTPLSAAEILSARPSWNQLVEDADPTIIDNKNALYREIKVENSELVKWDVAATLLDRLDLSFILGKW